MGLCVPDGRKVEQSKQKLCPLLELKLELICKDGPESQAVPQTGAAFSIFHF